MRKLIFTLFLMTLGTIAFAQKEYVNVWAKIHVYEHGNVYNYIQLSGAIPSTMHATYRDNRTGIGDVLNMLSQEGFVVEHMSGATGRPYSDSNGIDCDGFEFVLLSRNSSNTPSAIQRVQTSPNEEVTEVARYNLQGIPVSKSEKGVQIVVYSNYTTKTIVVE